MLRPAILAITTFLAACAAPGNPPSEAPSTLQVQVPAEGPNGRPNTETEWARAAREQRAAILAAAEATPEAKARYALMMDCWRYVSDYGTRKFFDDVDAGRPKDEVCDARAQDASTAFIALADEALTLSEMDAFQYFNSGLILDKEEFREVGGAAAQRAYLQQKAEACFAVPGLPSTLSASLLADCPISATGSAIAK